MKMLTGENFMENVDLTTRRLVFLTDWLTYSVISLTFILLCSREGECYLLSCYEVLLARKTSQNVTDVFYAVLEVLSDDQGQVIREVLIARIMFVVFRENVPKGSVKKKKRKKNAHVIQWDMTAQFIFGLSHQNPQPFAAGV
jgi:hypothetical protein